MAHLVAQAPPAGWPAIGGLYIAGTTIGGLTGRVLTGAVGGVAGWRWGLATTAAFVAIAAAVFVGLLRVRRPPPERCDHAGDAPPGSQRPELRLALSDRTVWVFYAQAFLLMGGFVTVYNLLLVPAARRPVPAARIGGQPAVPDLPGGHRRLVRGWPAGRRSGPPAGAGRRPA